MPTSEAPVISSWADEDEDNYSISLPPPSEKIIGDTKIITEYSINDDNKKVKHVRTYKIEKKLVPASIAARKQWAKYGKSRNDGEGPHSSTTVVSEEVTMQFVANKDEHEKDNPDKTIGELIMSKQKGVVKCRICKEDHWTTNCPYKDTLGPLRDSLAGKDEKDDDVDGENKGGAGGTSASTGALGGGSGKYIAPSRRGEGMTARDRITGDSADRRRMDDTAAIRVSNLSENAQESDLSDLFKPFGSIQRIFLAKDKITGQCKGFAFINYHRKEDAAKAIATLHGYGYDHLILNVEWAKPSGT